MTDTTIVRGIALTATTPTGTTGPVTSTWHYTTHNPYAITINLDTGDNRTTVEWLIGRDLLIEAITIHEPGIFTGEGDVQAWTWNGRYFINLVGPDATLLTHAHLDTVRSFLADTIALVLPGHESRHIDIDAGIATILGEVQP